MIGLEILSAALLSAGAIADSPAEASTSAERPQLVCRSIGETGSRLSRRRLCKTQAEWDEQDRQMRADIDQAQTGQINPFLTRDQALRGASTTPN